MIRHLTAAALIALAPGSVLAAGDALVLANGEYEELPRLAGANRVLAGASALEERGFDVVRRVEGTAGEMRESVAQFVAGLEDDATHVAVVLSGRFVHSASETYLLSVDIADPVDEAGVLTDAVSVSSLLGILAEFSGQAVLLLAEDDMAPLEGARFLSAGSGEIDPPQGVSLVRGTPREIEQLVRDDLARPQRNFVEAVSDAGLDLEGYAPSELIFVTQAMADEAASGGEPDDRGEARLWSSVTERDDIAGYETYLSAYPEGPNAAEARNRIAELRDAPRRRAEETEAALNLSRSERQEVQGDLTTLDYDTRGVDGIFGEGSRRAISRWQDANGEDATGYLTEAQVDRIAAQAQRAEAEQARRAEEERRERQRRDDAYWRDLGDNPDAQALRGYIDRFPNGSHVQEAKQRLNRLEDNAREQAAERDRNAFDHARDADTVKAYGRYLDEWPNGAFVGRAQDRIAALRDAQKPKNENKNNGNGGDGNSRAAAEEQSLTLPQPARALAEQRLSSMGFDAGVPDGNFDANTRKALRRYQDARGIPVSGYLDRATAQQLLQDSIFGR
ncbi:hypothetical protein OCH239_07495 [Roseivivax halodurans JCM 10272]|uniref:Peptidoglycan binding-like domain-containing protein n=1 Tax=Roseivivax halodurans JCM 10272 TaxID=1449350 RepID=X7EK35_9RHOB|nr:peptidoglycan-binding protein [Roseivivax halodurans]ETX16250.1 hypothetical protein OCH239_07495 [Roseivivax halodurans JCM 10272]